jgi:hypothetical protein
MIRQRASSGTAARRRGTSPAGGDDGRTRIDGVVVGSLVGLDSSGAALVDYRGNIRGPLPARTIVSLSADQVGREVALMFDGGELCRPLIMGVLQDPGLADPMFKLFQARVDAQTITIVAEKELVLCCGDASVTLTRAGKVIIRGRHVSSRSSGVNRILGGSVQIN